MDLENPYRSPEAISPASDVPRNAADLAWIRLVNTSGNGIIARRWVATWLDSICLIFLFMLANAAFGDALHQKLLPFTLCTLALYHPILEGFTGRTVGKF